MRKPFEVPVEEQGQQLRADMRVGNGRARVRVRRGCRHTNSKAQIVLVEGDEVEVGRSHVALLDAAGEQPVTVYSFCCSV